MIIARVERWKENRGALMRISILLFPRKRESSVFRERRWVPAFTGTTIQGVQAT